MKSIYNSDGYVMLDLTDVDTTRQTQNVPGIYERLISIIDVNKLVLLVNHEGLTPQAAIVHKRLNYYVINTTLYIYTINSNDIVIIEQAGTATVDVEIVPTLTEGVKIADFAIGDVEGALYAPRQESEINDGVTASNTTWSSEKISNQLSGKADTSDIPVLTDLINDNTTSTTAVWSSDKTAAEIAAGAGVTIDDTTTSLTKTWSSDKINSEVSSKPSINDTTASNSTVYSSNKVDTLLSGKADTSTTYTKTEVDSALSNKANVLDVTALATALNGYQILSYNVDGAGGLLTLPSYTDSCIIFISRGGSGLYMGHWSGVTPIVADSNFDVIYYSNPSRINVRNNTGTTSRVVVFIK